MKILGLNITRASLENPSVSIGDPAAHGVLFGELPSASGVNVSEATALNYSTVWACINLISGTIGQLPLGVRRRTGENQSEPARDHPVNALIGQQPNSDTGMTSADWREAVQTHVLTRGNGYTQIMRKRSGEITRLNPLSSVEVDTSKAKIAYKVKFADGTDGRIPSMNMLHVRGLSPDGIIGHSVIQRARDSIGLGMAAEQYGARLFANDARPNVVLEHPGKLGPDVIKNIKAAWTSAHSGANRFTPAVVSEGMTVKEVGFPPEDSQFLETRRFQVADVCRWFGVPPFMIGDTERSTSWGTGIEQQTLGFINFVLAKWLVRWEQEMNAKLFPKDDEEHFVKFNLNALLRGDFKTRTDGYASGIQNGWITRNEVRALEDLNPLEGLDDPLVPLNMGNTNDIEEDISDDGNA